MLKKYKFHFIILLGAFLRLWQITKLDIWRDESFSINIAKLSLNETIYYAAKDTSPPLHAIVLHFVTYISDSAFFMRLPSVFAGVVLLIFVYLLAKRVFDSKRVALWATLFAALNPLLIFYSQEARGYSMLACVAVASLYFMLEYNYTKQRKMLMGFVISALCGLYLHNLFVIFFAVITLYQAVVLYRQLAKRDLAYWFGAYFVIGVYYTPWLFALSKQAGKVGSGFWKVFDPKIDVPVGYAAQFVGHHGDKSPEALAAFLVFAATAIGVTLSFIGLFNKKSRLVAGVCYATLLITAVLSFKIFFFYVRYIIFAAPLLMILAAAGTDLLHKRFGAKLSTALVCAWIVIVTAFYFNNVRSHIGREEYRKAIADIEYNKTTDIILHPHAATYHSFRYYNELPSYVYDPERDIYYYEGISYLQDSDYYDYDLAKYSRIWVVDIWGDQSFEDKLNNLGYRRLWNKAYADNQLYLNYWEKTH